MIQILQAIKELLLITLAFFKQHNQILQLINFSSFILTFCLLLLINIPSIIFIFISLILLFKEFIIKMIIIAIDIIIYIISHWKEIKQILLNIGIDICSLIMIAIMSLGFSLDVYMKNANAKNDIEFIILTMLISMLFMIFFSSIAIFINSKKFYNIIAFEINKYIHNVIVSIIFVAILGLKDLIAKYIEAGHLFDFPKGSIISTNDIITVIIYMFFVLILCYQHTYIIVNKLIVHKSVSEKPLN